MTLSNADKDQIRAEEIFRREIARSLDRGSGMVRFFNSPLGLWVLSSIFLTGIISGAHLLNGLLEKRAKEQQLREDVAYEINTHCGEFVGAIKKVYNYEGYSRAFDDHLKRLPQCHLSRFKDATIDQLIWELHSLSREADKRVANDITNSIYERIWPTIWELSWKADFVPGSPDKTDFDASLYKVLHEQIMDRIQSNATQ